MVGRQALEIEFLKGGIAKRTAAEKREYIRRRTPQRDAELMTKKQVLMTILWASRAASGPRQVSPRDRDIDLASNSSAEWLGRKSLSQAGAFEAERFGNLVSLGAALRQSQHMANACADASTNQSKLEPRRQSAQSHRQVRRIYILAQTVRRAPSYAHLTAVRRLGTDLQTAGQTNEALHSRAGHRRDYRARRSRQTTRSNQPKQSTGAVSLPISRSFGRRRAMNIGLAMNTDLAGIRIPDSKLAREIVELVRDTEPPLLFHHSSRVYFWGALAGKRRGLRFDPELLYAGAMFHDMGLTDQHSSADQRFEVDGANAARDFLRRHGIAQGDIDLVWTAIALHTTPGIPAHMHPIIALVTAGVEMDVLGIAYEEFTDAQREAVVAAYPRTPQFKEDIIKTFYDGIKHKPETTFGNVKADVLADKDPHFVRGNFCSVIRGSHWHG
jgi:HD domain